jgi:hypothetical protein
VARGGVALALVQDHIVDPVGLAPDHPRFRLVIHHQVGDTQRAIETVVELGQLLDVIEGVGAHPYLILAAGDLDHRIELSRVALQRCQLLLH